MPQNLNVPNSVRSVAGISAQSTGALTELKKLKFVFGIQIVYFSEILRAKYPKLEYWSDENPSVITSRWRKRSKMSTKNLWEKFGLFKYWKAHQKQRFQFTIFWQFYPLQELFNNFMTFLLITSGRGPEQNSRPPWPFPVIWVGLLWDCSSMTEK